MYSKLLIIILLAVGLYFTVKCGLLQIRMFGESIRVVGEKPDKEGSVFWMWIIAFIGGPSYYIEAR